MKDTTRPTADDLVAGLVQALPDSLREDYEERAAIMQFDGELSSGHAEALALLDVLARHPTALLGIDAFQITRDGRTRFLLCNSGRITQSRLQVIGYDVIEGIDLASVLHKHLNGIAFLVAANEEAS